MFAAPAERALIGHTGLVLAGKLRRSGGDFCSTRVMRTLFWAGLVVAGFVVGGASLGSAPVGRTPRPHPNLAAAQKLTTEAWQKVCAAQRANEFDLAGHAQQTRELLEQANAELKLAAEAADFGNPK